MEVTKGYLLQMYLMSLLKYKIVFCDCEETYVGEVFKKRYRNYARGCTVKLTLGLEKYQ